MIRTSLQAPGAAGSYDPETSLAGFDFSAGAWPPDFFKPDLSNWRRTLAIYHEWIYHFQFHATTFGYLYRIVANTQLLLANGILRRAKRDRKRVRLPLASRSTPIMQSLDDPMDFDLRAVTLLQRSREGVLGFQPHATRSDIDEFRIAASAFMHLFGGPSTIVIEPTFMPEPPRIRYPVRDLLETHAHILSALWLMQAVERTGADRSITAALLNDANAQLAGPYKAFIDFTPDLPGEADRLKLFCALAEVALNPPGVHRHPMMQDNAILAPLHTSWFPVVRMETLLSFALKGLIRGRPDSGWPDAAREIMESVQSALEQAGVIPSAFLAGSGGLVAMPVLQRVVDRTLAFAARDDDVPPPLLAFQVDALGKLLVAEELRNEGPLLLSGSVIEELKLLTSGLGGASAVCDDGSSARTIIGNCMGLHRLGLLSTETLQAGSDAIVTRGAPIAHALHLLVTYPRADLETRLDKPLLATRTWTLRSVLAEHYGMVLTHFD